MTSDDAPGSAGDPGGHAAEPSRRPAGSAHDAAGAGPETGSDGEPVEGGAGAPDPPPAPPAAPTPDPEPDAAAPAGPREPAEGPAEHDEQATSPDATRDRAAPSPSLLPGLLGSAAQRRPPGSEPEFPPRRFLTPTRVGGLVGLAAGWWQLRPWFADGDLLVRDLVAVREPVLHLGALAGGAGHEWDLLGRTLAVAVGQVVGMPTVVVVSLVLAFIALGAGTGRLAGTNGSRVAAGVAALAATWNPFVWARLQQGTWWTVVALAALPWVVIHLRGDHRWRLARSVLIAGIAGAAGWTVVVPTLLAVAVVARRLRAAVPAFVVLVATAVPAILAAGSFTVDADGFEALAAHGDLLGAVVPSLLTGGGHWNAAVAAPSRAGAVAGLFALLVAVLAVWGAGLWREAPRLLHDWRTRNGLIVGALVGLVGTFVMATAAGQAVLAGLAQAVPWLAALRDSTDLLAPWVLLLAIGLGHLFGRVGTAARRRAAETVGGPLVTAAGPATALVGMVVVVAVLPDPLVGDGLPEPGAVPASWSLAAEEIGAGPEDVAVLVVPGDRQQAFSFAPEIVRVALDQMVDREVLTDQRWLVRRGGQEIAVDDDPATGPTATASATPAAAPTASPPGEEASVEVNPAVLGEQPVPTTSGPTARQVRDFGLAWPDDLVGRDLAESGIGWVAVVQPSSFAPPGPGLETHVESPEIQLVRLDPAVLRPAEIVRPQWPLLLDAVIATLAVALLLGAGPLRTGREQDPV